MSRISAKIVADSMITICGSDDLQPFQSRITTFILTFPRFLLAEFNTHRMLSRNSASSRARPFKSMLASVEADPFVPPFGWMAAHKGMQGSEFLTDEQSANANTVWLQARDAAVESAIRLDALGVSKQMVNRILEPFMWHEVIVTGTDFENFLALRAHPDAEIHIRALAEAMLDALNNNIGAVRHLQPGEWHIPFGDAMDESRIAALVQTTDSTKAENEAENYYCSSALALSAALPDRPETYTVAQRIELVKLEIAAARCARISYTAFGSEDKYNYANDRRLFRSLVDGNHVSPLEHVARAMSAADLKLFSSQRRTLTSSDNENSAPPLEVGWCGNFRGFIQLRKFMRFENRKDERLKK